MVAISTFFALVLPACAASVSSGPGSAGVAEIGITSQASLQKVQSHGQKQLVRAEDKRVEAIDTPVSRDTARGTFVDCVGSGHQAPCVTHDTGHTGGIVFKCMCHRMEIVAGNASRDPVAKPACCLTELHPDDPTNENTRRCIATCT
mmetsp:Transcript_68717/g.109028  ORF Transcript_68717/g.109028 Transcript_68717/m.109028 type:complete len:147 (+) Transcript_68717:65-505(+)